MNNLHEYEVLLLETFDDQILQNNEKQRLITALNKIKTSDDKLNYVRNTAFDIAQDYCAKNLSDAPIALRWLEKVVKAIDVVRGSSLNDTAREVYFSPGKECKTAIISRIKAALHSVNVCVFTISDNDISDALAHAHKRGVSVRIISDNDKANDRGSDIYHLASLGLNIVKDRSPSHMHHKYAIIDQAYVINGSFNWTRSASKYNNENIVVHQDHELAKAFSKNFDSLWAMFSH